jgi:hypothetical protein
MTKFMVLEKAHGTASGALPPPVARLLRQVGIQANASTKIPMHMINQAFRDAKMTLQERMHAKDLLARAGMID